MLEVIKLVVIKPVPTLLSDLVTSDCIVKPRVKSSSLPSFLRGLDYRVCPTIEAMDILISQILTLPYYSPIWVVGHNKARHIIYFMLQPAATTNIKLTTKLSSPSLPFSEGGIILAAICKRRQNTNLG